MIGSAFARAKEAPGRGYHWGMATPHSNLPRGTRIRVGIAGPLEQILFGPAFTEDGTLNLVGAIRTCMGSVGAANIRELQQTELIIAPVDQDRGQGLPARPEAGHAAVGLARGDPGCRRRRAARSRSSTSAAQYTQLIARRIRELGVYSEILPCTIRSTTCSRRGYTGLVLSGGPSSVYEDEAPAARQAPLEAGIPMLGICYGMQAMGYLLGGHVVPGRAARVRPGRSSSSSSREGLLAACARARRAGSRCG